MKAKETKKLLREIHDAIEENQNKIHKYLREHQDEELDDTILDGVSEIIIDFGFDAIDLIVEKRLEKINKNMEEIEENVTKLKDNIAYLNTLYDD